MKKVSFIFMSRMSLNYKVLAINAFHLIRHSISTSHSPSYGVLPGAIIGDGDRKSWDARGPMIWDNFSIFRTNCAILTSYIRADPRTCRGLSRECCHVA